MSIVVKGFYLGVVLAALIVNSGCGSSQSAAIPVTSVVQTGPHQVVVTLLNSGTQDASLGAQVQVPDTITTTIPAVIIRIQGNTTANGIGVGIDLGNGIGQCYYQGSTTSPSVFTLNQCTNNLVAGSSVVLDKGQSVTMWSYSGVNSTGSVVELVLTGETQ